MSVAEILDRLREGNNRFMADALTHESQDSARRAELVATQEPPVIVLSCADSRVTPELAFDAGLGQLFVVRVAGNIANTSSVASIEYAVAHCKSKVIVVLGHQKCGAVTAAVNSMKNADNNGYNLNHLLSHITPAINSCGGTGADIEDVVRKNAELTGQDLMGRSSIIRGAVESGTVSIVPAYYHLDSGRVDFL